MSEKRFFNSYFTEHIIDKKTDKCYPVRYVGGVYELTDLLNELAEELNTQQATIQRMKHSLNTIYKAFEKHYGYDMRNAIWLIDELSYDDNEIGFDSDE